MWNIRTRRTSELINDANRFIENLKKERKEDYGIENQIMTNEFVENIKKESSENIKNIVKNCSELQDIYLETSKNFAKVSKVTKNM